MTKIAKGKPLAKEFKCFVFFKEKIKVYHKNLFLYKNTIFYY